MLRELIDSKGAIAGTGGERTPVIVRAVVREGKPAHCGDGTSVRKVDILKDFCSAEIPDRDEASFICMNAGCKARMQVTIRQMNSPPDKSVLPFGLNRSELTPFPCPTKVEQEVSACDARAASVIST